MRPFSACKANGELRIRSRRPGGEKAVAPKKGRSRSTNSIFSLPGVDGHSARARRFRDLIRDALAGIEAPDQGVISLARSVALASLRIEALQARIVSDEGVDDNADMRFVRLTLALGRVLRQLAALKPKKAQPQPPVEERPGEALGKYLAEISSRPTPSA
jgi:hypothetical protein